jgi:phosphotransferase system  glucose/maltose/N-acetylglucosamine-specific IIC component
MSAHRSGQAQGMSGAVFFTMIVAIVVVLIAGLTPFLLIPVVVIGLGALVALPMLAAAKEGARPGGAAPSGVPSTREASYDPRQEPGQQAGTR